MAMGLAIFLEIRGLHRASSLCTVGSWFAGVGRPRTKRRSSKGECHCVRASKLLLWPNIEIALSPHDEGGVLNLYFRR
jgi:hypothetical protein